MTRPKGRSPALFLIMPGIIFHHFIKSCQVSCTGIIRTKLVRTDVPGTEVQQQAAKQYAPHAPPVRSTLYVPTHHPQLPSSHCSQQILCTSGCLVHCDVATTTTTTVSEKTGRCNTDGTEARIYRITLHSDNTYISVRYGA